MRVRVVGAARYVSSHACLALAEAGCIVKVFDDLSTGHRRAVQWGHLIAGSIMRSTAIYEAMVRVRPDTMMHFAARSIVGESKTDPDIYSQPNAAGTPNLLGAMRRYDAKRLVFSSRAAIFGELVHLPINDCTG